MAAVAGSAGETGFRFVARPGRAPLRLVAGEDGPSVHTAGRSRLPGARSAARRRAAGLVATLVALAGLWAGAGALRATQDAPAGAAGHAVVYVVRPRDTLWAIATRLDPAADPEQVVAVLAAELHGAPLRPGAVLTIPAS
ncbi:MAG: LysM peptidoglycan-binding domain-containing protein [Acidimicrobiales bacterium]|jgi:nucleoid-associated protein YgaU